MKANAPEKIYLVIDPVCGSMSVNYNRNDTNNIEYVRNDAFIEKAAEWLSKYAKKYYFNKEKYLGTDELVEDFKITMKL